MVGKREVLMDTMENTHAQDRRDYYGVYHVFNKSISGYKIFNNLHEYKRMIHLMHYYQHEGHHFKFSYVMKTGKHDTSLFVGKKKLVEIVAYCLMPTHVHFILMPDKENGITRFMNVVLNSYTRYFNIKHRRKGPLWQSRSKKILIETDEQLIHLTRYIHLNPVTAYLVDTPEAWEASSYREYLSQNGNRICAYDELFQVNPRAYKEFVDDTISYQRERTRIKKVILE